MREIYPWERNNGRTTRECDERRSEKNSRRGTVWLLSVVDGTTTPHGNERPHSAAVMVAWPWCVGIVDGPFRTERPAERRESHCRSHSTWLLSLCRSLFLSRDSPYAPLIPRDPSQSPPPLLHHRSVSVAPPFSISSSPRLYPASPCRCTFLPSSLSLSFSQNRTVLLRFTFSVSTAPSRYLTGPGTSLSVSLFLSPWRSDAVGAVLLRQIITIPLSLSPFFFRYTLAKLILVSRPRPSLYCNLPLSPSLPVCSFSRSLARTF